MFGIGRAIKTAAGSLLRPSAFAALFRGERKKAVFYGACHAIGVAKILQQQSAFQKQYEAIILPANFSMNSEQLAHAREHILPHADLFIYQPYTGVGRQEFSTADFLKRLKPSAQSIRFAYPHCEIYQPFTYYPVEGLPAFTSSYIDYAFGRAILDGMKPSEIVAHYRHQGLLTNYADQLLPLNLRELRDRENRVLPGDLPIQVTCSDIVERDFRSKHLFLTMNHPSVALLNEVARRICELIPLPFNPVSQEVLSYPVLPIPSYVRDALGLEFAAPDVQPGNYYELMASYFMGVDPKAFDAAVAHLSNTRPWFQQLAATNLVRHI